MPRRSLLILAFATVCLVWGSTYLAIRVALEGFPPFFIGAVRFVLAGAALFAVARARGEAVPSRKEWASSLLAGTLFFVVGNGLVNLAERSVSSGLVSVLVATMPLWATVFARAFGTAPTGRELAGVGLGLVGVLVLNLGGDLRASPGGALLALLAPMGWALGSVVSQRLPAPPGVMRTAAQMISGGLAMLVLSAVTRESFGVPSARAVFALGLPVPRGIARGFHGVLVPPQAHAPGRRDELRVREPRHRSGARRPLRGRALRAAERRRRDHRARRGRPRSEACERQPVTVHRRGRVVGRSEAEHHAVVDDDYVSQVHGAVYAPGCVQRVERVGQDRALARRQRKFARASRQGLEPDGAVLAVHAKHGL